MGAGLRSEQQDFTTSLGTTGSSMKRAGERGSGRHPARAEFSPRALKRQRPQNSEDGYTISTNYAFGACTGISIFCNNHFQFMGLEGSPRGEHVGNFL